MMFKERIRMYCPMCGEVTEFELVKDSVYYFDGHWYREFVYQCMSCLLKGATPYEVKMSYEVFPENEESTGTNEGEG